MSVGAILTRGLGSFGSVNKIPTLGYAQAEVIENLIRLSVTAYLLTLKTVSGKELNLLTVAGKHKTAITLTGVFRNV